MSEVSINIFKYEGDFRVSVNNDTPVRFIPPETYIRDYLREKDLSGEKAVRIGNELFERVFNTKERAERFKELIKNLSSMDRLTISIISDDSFIHEIPWEVLNIDRKSFLLKSVNISILRSTANSVSFSRSLNLPFKILIALSLPVETYRKSPLDALREIDIIYKALGELLGDGTAEIDVLENTNVKTIRERLTKDRYDILHLIGHGNIGGSLVFEDSNDYTKEYKVTNDDIEKIFRNTPLQCVVLNACHTASSHISPSTALVINKMGIPLVIANQSSIRDDEAIALSRGIYQGLLKRDPVENLLNTSRINIGTDWWKPVIFTPLRERSLPVSVRLAESAAKKRGFISIGSININSVSAFVYRFEPVRRLGNLLSGEGRVMVMHGIGGAGKSVLASYAAKFYKERFDIVIFMNIGDIKTPGELIDTAAERLMRDRFIGEDEIAGIKKEKDPVLKWRRLYKSLNNALLFLILDNLETAQYRDGKIKEGDGWHDFIMGLIDEGGFRGKLLITTRIIPVKDNIRWTREENIIEIGEYEDNEFILYLEMISKEMGLILPGNFRGLIGHTGKHPLGVYTALRLLKEMGQSGFEIKDIINEISDRLRFYDGYLHIKSFIPPYPLSAGFMKRLSGSESFRLMNESLRIFKREGLNGVNYLTPYPILRRYALMGLEDDKKKMFIQEIIGEMKEHEIEGLYYYLNLGFMASGIGDEDTSYDMIPFLSHEALGGIMIDERLDVLERLKDSIHSEERLASTLHQIGMVYQSKGDYKKAFSYYKEALEIFKRYNDIKFTMTAYNNIIDALLKDKRLEDAEGYIIDALSMEKQLLHLSPGIVIPNTLRTLRFAMEIKDRAKDKTTIEGLLSSQDFKILIDSLKEDSGI